MAHEIEQMFSVTETPWHKLGRVVQQAPNVEEAIKLAGLNWNVGMKPLFTQEGRQVTHRAIVRETDQSIFGIVGPEYTPIQNERAFQFFNPFLDSGACTLETAGSLRGGKKVWILAKLNKDPMRITSEDIVNKYLLLSNSHEGGVSARVGFAPIRVVCANTLAMAVNNQSSQLIRVHHSAQVLTKLDQIQEIVNTANASFEATAEQYRALAKSGVTTEDVEKFVKLVFFDQKKDSERIKLRIEKMTETITRLFETGRGNDLKSTRGTMWALYNGATEYLSHEAGKDEDSRLSSLWFGAYKNQNERAMEVALQMAVA